MHTHTSLPALQCCILPVWCMTDVDRHYSKAAAQFVPQRDDENKHTSRGYSEIWNRTDQKQIQNNTCLMFYSFTWYVRLCLIKCMAAYRATKSVYTCVCVNVETVCILRSVWSCWGFNWVESEQSIWFFLYLLLWLWDWWADISLWPSIDSVNVSPFSPCLPSTKNRPLLGLSHYLSASTNALLKYPPLKPEDRSEGGLHMVCLLLSFIGLITSAWLVEGSSHIRCLFPSRMNYNRTLHISQKQLFYTAGVTKPIM